MISRCKVISSLRSSSFYIHCLNLLQPLVVALSAVLPCIDVAIRCPAFSCHSKFLSPSKLRPEIAISLCTFIIEHIFFLSRVFLGLHNPGVSLFLPLVKQNGCAIIMLCHSIYHLLFLFQHHPYLQFFEPIRFHSFLVFFTQN